MFKNVAQTRKSRNKTNIMSKTNAINAAKSIIVVTAVNNLTIFAIALRLYGQWFMSIFVS